MQLLKFISGSNYSQHFEVSGLKFLNLSTKCTVGHVLEPHFHGGAMGHVPWGFVSLNMGHEMLLDKNFN